MVGAIPADSCRGCAHLLDTGPGGRGAHPTAASAAHRVGAVPRRERAASRGYSPRHRRHCEFAARGCADWWAGEFDRAERREPVAVARGPDGQGHPQGAKLGGWAAAQHPRRAAQPLPRPAHRLVAGALRRPSQHRARCERQRLERSRHAGDDPRDRVLYAEGWPQVCGLGAQGRRASRRLPRL